MGSEGSDLSKPVRSALERRYLATHTRGEVEKIMQVQAKYLWIYALFYREFGDVRYRRAAEAIHRYARTFGTPGHLSGGRTAPFT